LSAPVLSWLFHALRKVRRRSQNLGKTDGWHPQLAPQSPPIRTSFVPGTPRPNPQSQSLSRGYGSILPTSLIYIVLSTRGCTPWRPEAVMSTTRGANKSRHWVFKGRRKRTGQYRKDTALPVTEPYRRSIRFQGPPNC
jgi:hypothetical protein